MNINTLAHQPSKTFFIKSAWPWCCMAELPMIHLLEHRYCNRGTLYFPQKSTNLMCSTRLSKKTPENKKPCIKQLKLSSWEISSTNSGQVPLELSKCDVNLLFHVPIYLVYKASVTEDRSTQYIFSLHCSTRSTSYLFNSIFK